MIALFIDGPLAGEVKDVSPSMVYSQTYRVQLPETTTVCDCDPGLPLEYLKSPRVFEYHLVAKGPKVLIYTESTDDLDIVHSLKEWRASDFGSSTWSTNCRDRRAFR